MSGLLVAALGILVVGPCGGQGLQDGVIYTGSAGYSPGQDVGYYVGGGGHPKKTRKCYQCAWSPPSARYNAFHNGNGYSNRLNPNSQGIDGGWDKCKREIDPYMADLYGINKWDCEDNCYTRTDKNGNFFRGCYNGEFGVDPNLFRCHDQAGSRYCFCEGDLCNGKAISQPVTPRSFRHNSVRPYARVLPKAHSIYDLYNQEELDPRVVPVARRHYGPNTKGNMILVMQGMHDGYRKDEQPVRRDYQPHDPVYLVHGQGGEYRQPSHGVQHWRSRIAHSQPPSFQNGGYDNDDLPDYREHKRQGDNKYEESRDKVGNMLYQSRSNNRGLRKSGSRQAANGDRYHGDHREDLEPAKKNAPLLPIPHHLTKIVHDILVRDETLHAALVPRKMKPIHGYAANVYRQRQMAETSEEKAKQKGKNSNRNRPDRNQNTHYTERRHNPRRHGNHDSNYVDAPSPRTEDPHPRSYTDDRYSSRPTNDEVPGPHYARTGISYEREPLSDDQNYDRDYGNQESRPYHKEYRDGYGHDRHSQY